MVVGPRSLRPPVLWPSGYNWRRMAAPEFSPTPVVDTTRAYTSPPVVHEGWWPNRPAEVRGFQPMGDRLGYQGPNQGLSLIHI